MEGFFKKRFFSKRNQDSCAPDWQSGERRPFARTFDIFQKTLDLNNQALDMIAVLGDVLSGDYIFDQHFIESKSRELAETVYQLIGSLNTLSPRKYQGLYEVFQNINKEIEMELSGRLVIPKSDYVLPYSAASRDFMDVVGAKNSNLAEVANAVGLEVPPGFAVTTRAFGAFMDHNELWDKTSALTKAWREGKIPLEEASKEIQAMLLDARIPRDVNKAINRAIGNLERELGYKNLFFAVRSSAGGEDGEHSFAGLHLSVLNVPADELVDAYKRVLASLYTTAVMEYRQDKGFLDSEAVMAVGCLVMVDAHSSGVIYTLDPMASESGNMVITSAHGLGAPVVSGSISGSRHLVSRDAQHSIKAMEVEPQKSMLVLTADGGTECVPVDEKRQNQPALKDKQLRELVEAGLLIERHFKRPQDIEYAFDRKGRLYILQARPLKVQNTKVLLAKDLPALLSGYKVIFQDQGTIAQRGVGTGKAYLIKKDEDLEKFPAGAVLVARHTTPRFAEVIRKTSAILTDVGSPTGHLATIAREFRVPSIVGTQVATSLLKHGQEITVDAEGRKVYDGIVKELEFYNLHEEHIEESREYRLLRRILKKVAPLNLVDPHARSFSPGGARTLHDITRFVHEKAVEELINLQNCHRHDPDAVTGKLKLSVPLDLVYIDIGHGLATRDKHKIIEPEDIESLPMKSFVKGLVKPGAWSTAPTDVDFSSFMSSLTRTFASGLSSPNQVGQNLAVISKNYANISLRLGYHFNMIDSYIGDNQNSNYAYFRFMGGVTDPTRRSRRARFLADILSIGDFRVEVRGDLVVARLKKLPNAVMQGKLYFLGVLVAYARQLDVQMTSESHVNMYVDMFKRLMQSNEA